MSRRHTTAVYWMVVLFVALARVANAQAPVVAAKPHLMAATLRRACIYSAKTPSHPLESLCGLQIPDDASVQAWTLAIANMPSPDSVKALADKLTDAEWEGARIKLQDFENAQTRNVTTGFESANITDLQSRLLLGFTDFVVNRAQEQINTALIDRLQSRLCATSAVTAPYMVATCNVLKEGTVITPFSAPRADDLRRAARADLVVLPGNYFTARLIASDGLKPEYADPALLGRYAAYFIGQILAGERPSEALSWLATVNPQPSSKIAWDIKAAPSSAFLYFVSVFASGLEHDPAVIGQTWPTSDGPALRLLYGSKALLINAKHGRPFAPPTLDGKQAPCFVGECGRLVTFIANLNNTSDQLKGVQDAINRLQNETSADAKRADALQVVAHAAATLKVASNLAADQPSFERTRRVLSGVERVSLDLAAEAYTDATYHLIAVTDSLGAFAHLPDTAVRSLAFVSTIAGSKDSKDVSAAFSTFAAPPNSYLRKRRKNTGWFGSINAYAGMSAGKEWTCPKLKSCGNSANYGGAYLPLGAEFGHRVGGSLGMAFRSVALFVQAIDVGAIATWQLNNSDDKTAAEPEIGLRQVFAPGAHLLFGIRDLPIAIGAGMSAVPQLRKITQNGLEIKRNAVRPLSLVIAVDVPIFP